MPEKQIALNNLPPLPEPGFVGREKEVDEIVAALLDPDILIVTLVGPAGTGKTALALAVAHRLREQGAFPGGIVWLNFAAIQSPEKVWETIRETLDLPGPQAARRHLRAHPTLLILDGLDEAAQDMEMLAFLDRLPQPSKALVTSRKRVWLVGKELVVEGPAYRIVIDHALGIAIGDSAQIIALGDSETASRAKAEECAVAKDVEREASARRPKSLWCTREHYTAAIKAYRQALAFFDPLNLTDDDRRRYAEISYRLGVCLRLDDQWGPAIRQQEETFQQFKQLRDFQGQGRAYLEIARAYQAMNSYDLAALYYRDAYRLFKRAGDVTLAATAREEVGNLEYYLRILEPAVADWEEAARLYDRANRPGKAAIVRQNLAQVQAG